MTHHPTRIWASPARGSGTITRIDGGSSSYVMGGWRDLPDPAAQPYVRVDAIAAILDDDACEFPLRALRQLIGGLP